MQWWSLLILGIIAFLLLLAVILYTTLYAQSNTVISTTCSSNDDCTEGTICNTDGICVRTTECDGDNDCGVGSVCNGGRCTKTSCDKDSQCPIGQACQRGQCQRQTCTSDVDCTDSSFCIAGICVANSCKSSYQCPFGYGCNTNDGVCYQRDLPCTTSNDCYEGALACINGVCNGPFGCPDGWLEIDGFCYPITSPLLCEAGTFPIAGTCCPTDEYLGLPCNTDSQCGGSNPNCLDNQCICKYATVPQTFPTYPFAKCSSTSSCLTGKCAFGYCVPDLFQCVSTSNCPAGDTCILGFCKTTGNNMEGAYCIESSDYISCINSGRACVNAICTTKRGNIGDICINNTDCINGLECNISGEVAFCSIKPNMDVV